MPFSDAIKQLIAKARIVSFQSWSQTHPPEAIALFQAADDNGRYLTDADIAQLQAMVPQTAPGLAIAQQLRDRAPTLVEAARAEVLQQFPEITQPGGDLYPLERAEACWRDFWHFLRCISYGIAGGRTDYTSPEGLSYMQQLYTELKVPLPAMILGLEYLKVLSVREVQSPKVHLDPYFVHLIEHL
jgi:Phycobilisome protein